MYGSTVIISLKNNALHTISERRRQTTACGISSPKQISVEREQLIWKAGYAAPPQDSAVSPGLTVQGLFLFSFILRLSLRMKILRKSPSRKGAAFPHCAAAEPRTQLLLKRWRTKTTKPCLTLNKSLVTIPVCLGQVQAVRSASKDNLESMFEN